MADETLVDEADHNIIRVTNNINGSTETVTKPAKAKSRNKDNDSAASAKRRCVSTACIACRRRKSKVCKSRDSLFVESSYATLHCADIEH